MVLDASGAQTSVIKINSLRLRISNPKFAAAAKFDLLALGWFAAVGCFYGMPEI